MLMGRPKKTDKELPQRMRRKGNAFYHVVSNQWTPLGSDLAIARIKWAEIEGNNNGQTFSAALDKYFASEKFSELSDSSKTAYMSRAKILRRAFGKVNCKTISPSHIYTFLSKYKSASGGNQAIVLIKHAMEQARRNGWIDVNPANDIEKNKTKRRKYYLTDEDFQKIYEAGNDVVKSAMKLAYLMGQRPIDVLKIRLSDITEEGILIRQKKTDAGQLFVWTDELREAVAQAKAIPRHVRGMTLFCNSKGRAYDTREFRYQWAAARKAAGVPDAQFRDMRSKAATDAKLSGQDHQKLLGHTTQAMSDSYVKLPIYEKVAPLNTRSMKR